MNTVALTGRLTADIELKKTPSGVSVCAFSIAVRRPRVKDTTDFINCVAWRNSAEFMSQYFHKGDKVEITGVLTSRSYTDQSGNKRTAFEVVVDTAEFAESKGNAKNATATPMPESDFAEVSNDEDLPF